MVPPELYDMLKKVQEPKGYFFNKDKGWVLDILNDLLKYPKPSLYLY